MVNIVPDRDGIKLFSDNKIVGYVENDTLYCFDRDGYAVEIGKVEHQSSIESMYRQWLTSKA